MNYILVIKIFSFLILFFKHLLNNFYYLYKIKLFFLNKHYCHITFLVFKRKINASARQKSIYNCEILFFVVYKMLSLTLKIRASFSYLAYTIEITYLFVIM